MSYSGWGMSSHASSTRAWRDEIKARARGDKIKVRTGLANQDEHVAWAYLKHRALDFEHHYGAKLEV